MSFNGFTPSDFKVFEIPGFKPRMEAIKGRIRPKLGRSGASCSGRGPHRRGRDLRARRQPPRRTVNAPDDTWVAFALDQRGYKKHCHFKVAVSRAGVRFLFEAGPEHAQKKRWVAAWERHTRQLVPVLRRAKGLAGLRTSTTRRPSAVLTDLPADAVALGSARSSAHARRPVRPRPLRPCRGGGTSGSPASTRAARETFHLLARSLSR